MDAKELNDLYAPLWAKVPETRPEQLVVYDRDNGTHFVSTTTEPTWYLDSDEDDVNAVLCRVAVEDWLMKHGRVSLSPPRLGLGGAHSASVYFLPHDLLDPHDGLSGHVVCGPTIHHALVAAALAVAGATP